MGFWDKTNEEWHIWHHKRNSIWLMILTVGVVIALIL